MKIKKPVILLLLISIGTSLYAQKVDKKLEKNIEELITGFHGQAGIYIKNLRNNKIVAIHADTIYPTASMIKVSLLIAVMSKIKNGRLTYHQNLQYKDSLLYAGVDLLGSFKNNEQIELSKVMMLMLTMSDNTASLWLQSLAGKGSYVNELLDSLHYTYTRVNSRTPGRENAQEQYGWGQTTPREMATLFEQIYKGEIISKGASDKMLRLLNRNYFDIVSVSQLPPYATVYTKYGALDQTRNETVLVKGKKSNYVFCICTKNNKDESWKNDNEAWVLTRKLSKLLWNYFEPNDHWQPAADADLFN